MSSEEYITTQQLLTALRNNGINISEHQLRTWRNNGAIPRPKRKSLGRSAGFETRYPKQTVEQIEKLLAYLVQKRSIDDAILKLWYEGFQVGICKLFVKNLQKYKNEATKYLKEDDGLLVLSSVATREIEYTYQKQTRSKLIRRLRNRTRAEFPILAQLLLIIAFGITGYKFSYDEMMSNIESYHIKALLKSLKTEISPDAQKKTTKNKSKMEGALDYLSGLISPEHLLSVLSQANEYDLKVSADVLQQILNILQNSFPIFADTLKPLRTMDVYSQSVLIVAGLSLLKDPHLQQIVEVNLKKSSS